MRHGARDLNFVTGIVQGSYPAKERVQVGKREAKIPYNVGLAVVIPSRYILELLMREDVVKDGQRKYKERHEDKTLKPESASVKRPTADPAPGALTHDSFEDVLKRVGRKVADKEEVK
jgi:hypothetical protein